MFLSRIELEPRCYETRRAIASPQILHAAVEGCFVDKPQGKDRKLWRIDRLHDKFYILILSPEKPDFTHFSAQYCATGNTGETKDYTALLSKLQTGQRLRFRLRANPTHSKAAAHSSRGKVYAHVTVSQKKDWLMKKAIISGFTLNEDEFDITETGSIRFWRKAKDKPVQLGYAVYEGSLVVEDVKQFTNTLTQGIGRAKAYGCGLLTISR